MNPAGLPNSFTPENTDNYRGRFYGFLLEIRKARREVNDTPYPAAVLELLAEATNVKRVDTEGRPLTTDDQVNPMARWVADRSKQYSEETRRAWEKFAKKRGIALGSFPAETLRLMELERNWRFWSLYAIRAAEIFSARAILRVPANTEHAIKDFITNASKTKNGIAALLADERLMQALTPQDIPLLKILEESLPGLIESFENINIKDWYPHQNLRGDAKYRAWARDAAEIAFRNLGHCEAGFLSKLLSDPDLPMVDFTPAEKWYGEQARAAATALDRYQSYQSVMDTRMPYVDPDADIYRPALTDSPWLGVTAPPIAWTVNRIS